ncbi:hypothetical protein SAMN05216475_2931 [Pseudomonas synxantha]|uniref:Uncharacterized protein n=1 Tax=Pseudomonas synxantha TaxID=47883 RepID=A0AAX3I8V2_9PSED|nr:hypothetical protein C4K01_2268 [Pseudomonas synxantha]MDQ0980452.1 hypothetical protein [Pseudomonas synxantha]SDU39763.1 hypothetical protein SAMN05216475_2931 [Pseudomonas synxantha]VTR01138.1 Uncharacterised protein [Pseudomonas synxantha]
MTTLPLPPNFQEQAKVSGGSTLELMNLTDWRPRA